MDAARRQSAIQTTFFRIIILKKNHYYSSNLIAQQHMAICCLSFLFGVHPSRSAGTNSCCAYIYTLTIQLYKREKIENSLPVCRTRTTMVASCPTLRKVSTGLPSGSDPATMSIQQLTVSCCGRELLDDGGDGGSGEGDGPWLSFRTPLVIMLAGGEEILASRFISIFLAVYK